jgi:riboflavin kinase/FMN adenylyltransferase
MSGEVSVRVLDWREFTAVSPTAPDRSGEAECRNLPPSAMTIGVFDGIHLGHQALLRKIRRPSLVPVVITFKESPKKVLRPESYEGDILTLSQKLRIFGSLGIGLTVLIDFSENFNKLEGRIFVDLLQKWGNPAYLVIGSNFRCGYRLDTDAALIKKINDERGIETEVLDPVSRDREPVSSSRIRAAIASGRISEAAALLGRNVEIDLTGLPVIQGSGGNYINFGSRQRIIPPCGKYSVILYEVDSPDGTQTEISVDPEGIFVPSRFNARCIEFLAEENF